MTTMQWIGLSVGLLVVLVRFPGIFWPEAYRARVLAVLDGYPSVVRAIGALLWPLAVTILVLVARTLTILQVVMLVIAVLFVVLGVVIVFFPEGFRKLAETTLKGLPLAAVRVTCAFAVGFGLWIVYLSLSIH